MKFLIVDDHPIMRLGVRQLIAQAWPDAEVAEAESVAGAAAEFEAGPADAIVLDLSLPDASGSEAPALMLRIARGVPILVLSLGSAPAFVARLVQMGIAGYVPKGRAAEELVIALRAVLEGRRHVPADLAARLPATFTPDASAGAPHEQLSAQEFRVMQLIAAGRSPAQIADEMRVSVKSVNSYRARVLAKAGWANNDELRRYCLEHGLAGPDGRPPTSSG
jgi:DNA-binding NarL/FixJ family response regulator